MKRLFIAFALILIFSVSGVTAYASTEDEYYAVSLTALAFRDENGNLLGTVPEDEVVTVLRVDPRDSKRDWVLWNGNEGSVIRTGIKSLVISVEEYARKAVAKTGLNMRVPETYELITGIPIGGDVTVIGRDEYNDERVVVDYQGIVGSVLESGLMIFGETDLIIVSIDNQTIQMIKDGRVWCYSHVVTGMKGSRDTPRGLFKIKKLEKNATLVGEDYSVPVKYWMPFYGGYGLHDASWRSYFGGSIYESSGSHGCVNMPENTARTIFENAYVGYWVMVR